MSNKQRSGMLAIVLQLGKIKISLPVALTGFLGYYRATGKLDLAFLYTFFGILFMSMGSSTFNHIQERKTDLMMKRTSGRPLPAGKISLRGAVIIAMVFSLSGLLLLWMTGSAVAAGIGAFTLGWYNLVYTPLKRITPFAVLPGAIIGALPPLIGWAAGGGALNDREIILISFFLFIGQMPHYWLLLMKIGDEFKTAGLPVITEIFSRRQLRNLSFIWIISAAVTVVIFPAAGIMHDTRIAFVMIGVIVLFLIKIVRLSFTGEIMQQWRKAFTTVNLFYLFIILILIADKFSETYLYK